MTTESQIPLELREKVERELEAGERLQWMDMPVARYFTPVATGAFLFGIPWTAFAIFWTGAAAWGTSKAEGAGMFRVFPLFGLPFVLIGFGLLSSPFWAHRKFRRTIYAVTDRRAITFEGGRTMTVRSYAPEQLSEVYRVEKKDGTGDVILGRRVYRDSDSNVQAQPQGFLSVRDPRRVEALVKALAAQARPG